jgi:hypothetical protein
VHVHPASNVGSLSCSSLGTHYVLVDRQFHDPVNWCLQVRYIMEASVGRLMNNVTRSFTIAEVPLSCVCVPGPIGNSGEEFRLLTGSIKTRCGGASCIKSGCVSQPVAYGFYAQIEVHSSWNLQALSGVPSTLHLHWAKAGEGESQSGALKSGPTCTKLDFAHVIALNLSEHVYK